ncbi:hypothetical protein ACFHYQ_13295 [Sphaerimonospora cavernae]|uniref:Uncharacterized protein n=1 Tax=Sphaerimonospora cavernae TaxID=1740611 RepID=A0ABV6U479_9ACTN
MSNNRHRLPAVADVGGHGGMACCSSPPTVTADRHHHGPPRVHGLVLGYGSASRADVRHGCAVIRRLLAAQ